MTASLYVGKVMHRRLRPRMHRFSYRSFWLLVDLDQLAAVSEQMMLFSCDRPNLFSLYTRDHGDGTSTPLRTQIDRQLRHAGVKLAGGQVELLCMPRTAGFSFNPLSIYFCRHANGRLAAIVYEVHNTFGERHSYVMPVDASQRTIRQSFGKQFYVSPFLDMDLRYDARVTIPKERVEIGITASGSAGAVLHASLSATRTPFTDAALVRLFSKVPFVTLKVIAAIHWEALRLWVKRMKVIRRPRPLVSNEPAGNHGSEVDGRAI
jgi:DUF1365 family protein